MARDEYGRAWIVENAGPILDEFAGIPITVRGLYYQLVAKGLPNHLKMYKRVVAAMTASRWKGVTGMDAFVDKDREMFGETEADDRDLEDAIEHGKDQVKAWMNAYRLERWSNQEVFVEVWIEKKAIQGVFERPCSLGGVGLAPCKGYPSLTFLNEAAGRFASIDKPIILLYFGDHDPSGDDIPRSVKESLGKMGAHVTVERIALTADQVVEMGLPPAPIKWKDSRAAYWDGEGAVELDAIDPRTLRQMCKDAIAEHFDDALGDELKERETEERTQYREALKDFVYNLSDDEDEEEDEDDEEW